MLKGTGYYVKVHVTASCHGAGKDIARLALGMPRTEQEGYS
jgi:isoaspartyl peptidase/L-asparaginase-like protein (Ntn-hydrolase superfamily)